MGRHAAGNSFLRAVVDSAAQSESAIHACVPNRSAAKHFVEQVRELSGRVDTKLESVDALSNVSRALGLYVPGPGIARFASLRLRGRIDAYSIAGVTHTIASHAALASIIELADSAVMPWDALICTSHAVRRAVDEALQAKIDFLRWRLGLSGSPALPQLPVIPLGVHCADYLTDRTARIEARSSFGLSDDEVALLFVGRLSFHAKAHPFPMFVGAEEAAKSTGKKLVLLMCGWFANDAIKEAFVSGAARYFPSGRTVFLDGGHQKTFREAWAASDIFISLSDNIQESFGLTPLEAMAAGLPVLVSDWDGYRDTVRDGVDGFRIPVTQGLDGLGETLARHYESGLLSYDAYCGLSCLLVAPDLPAFTRELIRLVESPALREALGAAGRQHVRTQFDWSVVLPKYAALFDELADIRAAEGPRWKQASLPRSSPDKMSPARLFGHFSTQRLLPSDPVRAVPFPRPELLRLYQERQRDPLFSFGGGMLPSVQEADLVLGGNGRTLGDISRAAGYPVERIIGVAAVLLKMGLLLPADSLNMPT